LHRRSAWVCTVTARKILIREQLIYLRTISTPERPVDPNSLNDDEEEIIPEQERLTTSDVVEPMLRPSHQRSEGKHFSRVRAVGLCTHARALPPAPTRGVCRRLRA
jgi:hypothetical protein